MHTLHYKVFTEEMKHRYTQTLSMLQINKRLRTRCNSLPAQFLKASTAKAIEMNRANISSEDLKQSLSA